MTLRELIALVLLAAGLLIGLCSALALLTMRSAFDRLHLLAPPSMIGIALIVAAIIVRVGLSATGTKAILAGMLIILQGPIVTHMTARARLRTRLRLSRGERPGEEGKG